MKKLIILALIGSICFSSNLFAEDEEYSSDEETVYVASMDEYQLKMKLNVPRIYNNTQSLGYRKYQRQLVISKVYFLYAKDGSLLDVQFENTYNKTHKMTNGKNVTYKASLAYNFIWPRFNALGNNRTGKFKTASICFNLAADPSYNIGEFAEDNSLYITLAGRGNFSSRSKKLKKASGYAAGALGCGCMAYGHVSPTRKIGRYGPTDSVDDVAAVHGNWTLTLVEEEFILNTNMVIYR